MSILEPEFLKVEADEVWVEKKPERGDHIKVSRGLYSHHGIYVSDDEVIHFTGKDEDSIFDWSKPEVIATDLDYFLKGGVLEVKEYTDDEFCDLYPADDIVKYARACLGDKGYNLVFNNCEHFANVCTLGRFRSNQVERVFGLGGDYDMGLFGGIGRALKSLFGGNSSGGGSRSTSSTMYEPDKVKIAQIEADNKIKLANMEQDRVELIKEAQLEILEKDYYCKIAFEEAKARGFNSVANTIALMQDKLNEVAEKRLKIIESCSFQVIRDVENFYAELGDKIEKDNEEYTLVKMPKLLSILEQYEEDSPAYKLYHKRIEDDMKSQLESYSMQIKGITERQNILIQGIISSKEKMIEQTSNITKDLLENVLSKYDEKTMIETKNNNLNQLEYKRKLLESSEKSNA
ncbi:MAG: lecithin retinol acyltransferase family protein [Bacilli bacterium]|nr:lecithin retinol acyltransferase family protein [Bacilli bacterium]